MQNNGQICSNLADLQKTPRIEILKWLGEQKKLNDLPIGKLCGKK